MENMKKDFDAVHGNKDMDKIADSIMTVINTSGLTMKEVAAINYYIAKQTLNEPHNRAMIKNQLNLDTKDLSIAAVFSIQEILTRIYTEELNES